MKIINVDAPNGDGVKNGVGDSSSAHMSIKDGVSNWTDGFDLAKPFMESTSAHGFAHIVSAKRKDGKFLWTLIVLGDV